MRSTFVIAIAATVVVPAFVSALPTPQDGSLYVREVSDSKYLSAMHPTMQHASAVMSLKGDEHDPKHGQDHRHGHAEHKHLSEHPPHRHHHDHHDHHHHGHKYGHGHRHHGMHRRPMHAHSAHNALPMAHPARELQETDGSLDIDPQWLNEAYRTFYHDHEPNDVRTREAEGRKINWSQLTTDVGDMLGFHPVRLRDLADVLARETGSEAFSLGSIWDLAKEGFSVGKDAYDAYKDVKDAADNNKSKSSKRELLEILARETDSEALSLGSIWDAVKDIYKVGKDGYDVVKDIDGSSGNAQSSSSNTNGGITAPVSSTKREPLDILARQTGSEAISLGSIVGIAKDAYTVGKDGYDAYEAVKDAYNNFKSSRSLLDELD